MLKILIVCGGGFSSSLLEQKMRQYAKKIGLDVIIEASSVYHACEIAHEWDCVLLAPQVRYEDKLIHKRAPDVPIAYIDMRAYGRMNGEIVVKQALALVDQTNHP